MTKYFITEISLNCKTDVVDDVDLTAWKPNYYLSVHNTTWTQEGIYLNPLRIRHCSYSLAYIICVQQNFVLALHGQKMLRALFSYLPSSNSDEWPISKLSSGALTHLCYSAALTPGGVYSVTYALKDPRVCPSVPTTVSTPRPIFSHGRREHSSTWEVLRFDKQPIWGSIANTIDNPHTAIGIVIHTRPRLSTNWPISPLQALLLHTPKIGNWQYLAEYRISSNLPVCAGIF